MPASEPVRRSVTILVATLVAVALATGSQGSVSAPVGTTNRIAPDVLGRVDPVPARPVSLVACAPNVPPAARVEAPVDIDYWVTRDIENQIALLSGARSDVLFLGDSVTDFLERGEGKFYWDNFFEPLGALNFGIGGFKTSHVLWQVESGQVAIAAPKVVVLLIGSNNLGGGEAPADVATGVAKIIDEIGAQLPNTRVLLLGILPRGAPDDPLRALITETNRLLADVQGDRVTYLDMGAWFLLPDGSIPPLLMPDAAHPSYWGYLIYSYVVWNPLVGLLSK